jgi:transcriptional regulator with PAS, ATPase and Fis domain
MRRVLTSSSAILALGVTLSVGAACALGAWLYSRHHYQTLLDSARTTALGESELIRAALGGTMFLDEIGEVSQATQVKLLRVLDASTFRRVGANEEIHVDVRVLAATNRDLATMVRQGLFREDLFYRLSTITVEVPPLRERGEDIALLARHFTGLLNERFGLRKHMAEETLQVLGRHLWPGNVRELERAHIERALRSTQGHRGRAAAVLGISERSLYRKLRDYGLLT